MVESIDFGALQKIRKTFNRYLLTIGVTSGMILVIYFFSFASLIDKAPVVVFKIQVVTGIVFVFVLVYVKNISFLLTKFLLGRREPYRTSMRLMNHKDLEKDDATLVAELASRREPVANA